MKISLFQLELIINRIKEKYNCQIFNTNIMITEFENPSVKIEQEFDEWFEIFSKKEKLIDIMFELQYKMNQTKSKHKIDKLEIELSRVEYLKNIFKQLSESLPMLTKNEILGKLNKLESSEKTSEIETGFFSKRTIEKFNDQLNKLSLQGQILENDIHNKKTKPYVNIEEDLQKILEQELFL